MANCILKDSQMTINLSLKQHKRLLTLTKDTYTLLQILLTMPAEQVSEIPVKHLYRYLSILDKNLYKLGQVIDGFDTRYNMH